MMAVLCGLASIPSDAAERVVAYVTGWEKPPDIPATKLTHINYAFGKIDAAGKVVLPHPGVPLQLAHLRSLKAKNPQLRILLSIGGWEAEGFSDAASLRCCASIRSTASISTGTIRARAS